MGTLWDDIKESVGTVLEDVRPVAEQTLTENLIKQIRPPAIAVQPQPPSTMSVAQAEAQNFLSSNAGFYILAGVAALGVYLLVKKGRKK